MNEDGALTVAPAMLAPVARRATRTATAREREILGHVATGATNGEVAWLLGIAPGTVRKHLENAYAKLGAHTRTAAVAGLFELDVRG